VRRGVRTGRGVRCRAAATTLSFLVGRLSTFALLSVRSSASRPRAVFTRVTSNARRRKSCCSVSHAPGDGGEWSLRCPACPVESETSGDAPRSAVCSDSDASESVSVRTVESVSESVSTSERQVPLERWPAVVSVPSPISSPWLGCAHQPDTASSSSSSIESVSAVTATSAPLAADASCSCGLPRALGGVLARDDGDGGGGEDSRRASIFPALRGVCWRQRLVVSVSGSEPVSGSKRHVAAAARVRHAVATACKDDARWRTAPTRPLSVAPSSRALRV
jgi:hypothetical protein